MLVLVPLKPVVLILGFLSGLVIVGFIGSSLLDKTAPFESRTSLMQHAVAKPGYTHAIPEGKHAHATAANQAQ